MATYQVRELLPWATETFDWDIRVEVRWIDVGLLTEEELAFKVNRDLDESRAAEMSMHFLPVVAAGIGLAQLPDGTRKVVDGQTRIHAARAHEESQRCLLAIIYHVKSMEQAFALFVLKNAGATSLSTVDIFLAQVEQGYPPSVDAAKILARFGCKLEKRTRPWAEGNVLSARVVDDIYAIGDGQILEQTLEVVTEAWGRSKEALSVEVLGATARFICRNYDKLDKQHWADMKRRFAAADLGEMLHAANTNWSASRIKGSRMDHFEFELIGKYNYGRRKENLAIDLPATRLAREPGLKQFAYQWKATGRIGF
jgi:hypothetical protein